jgi:glucose uptake protein
MGCFYPLVSKAMSLPDAPCPYATGLFFVIGTALCSLPVNTFFMRNPIDGGVPVTLWPVRFGSVALARRRRAWWGDRGDRGNLKLCRFTGSLCWTSHFLLDWAARDDGLSAFWGVFVWREFHSPTHTTFSESHHRNVQLLYCRTSCNRRRSIISPVA